ncbi:head GIN domain-containing protein [Alkalitalea saponilacus]|uniref:Putative auto-transporter adhesin, head GIN domain n=1 Tax=Alkalitalea saponilacus TaxID=889453 RepID=A0A1T5HTE6_9BACT|nr:head GIN domain-containing protein [Alkalitalea saponilacus]ASB50195.1 hypothetical protein CDL62_14135 [Alkalitalea saponilacus]SKC23953.1 Putative auto-transporter adhesin, head GIN domain [Alkalitalea saponilacus]
MGKFLRNITCFLFGALLFISCEGIINLDLFGDGILTENVREIGTFREVEVLNDFVVTIIQGEQWGVTVTGDANLIPYVVTEIENSRLIIRRRNNFNLHPVNAINILVSTPVLSSIDNNGNGKVILSEFNLPRLRINNTGGSFIETDSIAVDDFNYISESGARAMLKGEFGNFIVRQIGSGETLLKGKVDTLRLVQEGSGIIDGIHLEANSTRVYLYGSGLIYCHADELLNVVINGSGRVFYTGDPQLSQSIQGDGIIQRFMSY